LVGDHVLRLVVFVGAFMVSDCCDHGNSGNRSSVCGIHDLLVFEQRYCDAHEPEKQKDCFIQESGCNHVLPLLLFQETGIVADIISCS
jgi:hypothetical protein